jgi:thiamine-phosphate pyrophosphorylase
MRPRIAGLYAIADTRYLDDAHLVSAVRAAIEGGARLVQYRDKGADPVQRERQAHALAVLCRQTQVLFLINDDVMLAKKVGADGVHLGRDDMSIGSARALLGPGATIGVSCYGEIERARRAQDAGADYVAFGSFFPSRTKPQAVRASVEVLRAARAELRVPIVAIGGITAENGNTLVEAGADALAVIDGVFGQRDTRTAAAAYARLFAS